MEQAQKLNFIQKYLPASYLVIFIGFLVFGFSENIKGPAIPRMQSDFGINELQLGMLLAYNSIGYLLACSFTGIVTLKLGVKTTSFIAFGSMTISGLFIYIANTYFTFSLSYFLMYVGNGMLEIVLAIFAAKIFIRNTGFMMNLSHFFYGLSSTIAPIIAASMMGWHIFGHDLGWRGMYLIMLSLCIIPMIPTIFIKEPKQTIEKEDKMPVKVFLKDPAAWLIIAILSFGVIAELSIGGWLVNYLEKAHNWTTAKSSAMLSIFFLFFMLARLLLGPIIDKVGFTKSLIYFSGIATFSIILGVLLGSPGVFLFALAGVGVAPIYPTVMALLAKRYPNGTETAITFTVTLMGIALVIGNMLIGFVIDVFKQWFTKLQGAEVGLIRGLQSGFIFIGLCALFCTLAGIFLYRYLQRKEEVI
ncbi:MAG TPA: MFS transporter [Bacillaceae bacterium]|nr:MFS transporter [Bacillaceae bacterium]